LTSEQLHDTDREIDRLSVAFGFAHNSFFAAFERKYAGTSRDEYEQKIVRAVSAARVSGAEQMAMLLGNPELAAEPEGFIYAGNAYLVEASAAMREKRLSDAAHLLMTAMFCAGAVLAVGSLDDAEAAVRANQRSRIASLGSEGKKKTYEGRIAKAHEIEKGLRLKHPNGWPSVRQAAIAVWAELKSIDLPGTRLSEDQAVATVSKWLKDVPVNKLKKKSTSK